MFEFHDLAVPALLPHEPHTRIAGCPHRRADRCGVIHALVRADAIENRVLAIHVEAGADARELQRRPQERLAQALALGRVIRCDAFRIDVAHRAISPPGVDELDRENVAVADVFTVLAHGVVRHDERIAGLDIEHEVDVPGEDLRKLHRRCVRESGFVGCLEQRILDRAARGAHLVL